MIRGRRKVEGGRPQGPTCDFCGEPLKRDKRFKSGWEHQHKNSTTDHHLAENRGAVYRCTVCHNPITLIGSGWVHQNPANDNHRAKQ